MEPQLLGVQVVVLVEVSGWMQTSLKGGVKFLLLEEWDLLTVQVLVQVPAAVMTMEVEVVEEGFELMLMNMPPKFCCIIERL